MLKLKGITKDYHSGELVVNALKGIDLRFRKSEFVSILGPSGCGKTTLLNIMGGLDKYTTGDLEINGVSTVNYKDRDWDNYRNHSVGFVFQSYNLIMHQSVLANVELALTLSGVSKKERRERAKQALIKVGLEKEIHKMPNQLSGGQMQRVAIARAIVNNPDIILADEPTGALDTETSVSVMEILKEISSDKLVVMVTHNPELAKEYSTRIISMSDGLVVNDTMPVSDQEEQEILDQIHSLEQAPIEENLGDKPKKKKQKKAKMSIWTAFSLSLKNLFTKKTRTILTSVAGSIGIIGIALIMSVSTGFQGYIDDVQRDTLSSQPITLTTQSFDTVSMITSFMGGGSSEDREKYPDENKLYPNTQLEGMADTIINSIKTSNLKAFKTYMEEHIDNDRIHGYSYNYYDDSSNTALRFYANSPYIHEYDKELTSDYKLLYPYNAQRLLRSDEITIINEDIINYMFMAFNDFNPFSSTLIKKSGDEYIDNWGLIKDQYDLLDGEWADEKIYTENGKQYADMMLVVDAYNQVPDTVLYSLGLRSEGHLIHTFCDAMIKMFDNTQLDAQLGHWVNEYQTEMGVTLDKGEFPTWSKYLNAKENADTKKFFIEYLVREKFGYTYSQLDNEGVDFADILYKEGVEGATTYKIIAKAEEYTTDTGSSVWKNKTAEQIDNQLNSGKEINIRIKGVLRLKSGLAGGSLSTGLAYSNSLKEELIKMTDNSDIVKALASVSVDENTKVFTSDADKTNFAIFANENGIITLDEVNANIKKVDTTSPKSISIYASNFDNKDYLVDFLDEYNDQAAEGDTVEYSDLMGTLFESVDLILNAITYVLIAFVSISLIVSSIMIGIITYISVLERTKEIGVLRSIGASKGDIGRVFNAETIIIGLVSGLFGVIVTILLNLPITALLTKITGASMLVRLPFTAGFILVLISVLFTTISGLIPSRIASKKDPVVALRTE